METTVTIVSGIVVALATAYFTSRFYVRQAEADLHKEFQGRFNEKRWEVYTQFSDLILALFQATSENRLDKEMPKIVRALRDFIGKLWLVGSDEVVRVVLVWRRLPTGEGTASGLAVMLSLANVLVAMRRDLGDTDTDLTARDILATFVNDIDKYVDAEGRMREAG